MSDGRELPLFPAEPVELSVPELKRVAVDAFPGSWARQDIWAGFERLLTHLTAIGTAFDLYVDGSFVTNKLAPEDIDLVIVSTEADLKTDQLTALRQLEADRPAWLRQRRCDFKVLYDLPSADLVRELDEALSSFALNFEGPPKRSVLIRLGGDLDD